MSGGRWNYEQHQMESCLLEVSRDPDVQQRFPRLADRLGDLAGALGKIVHDLDWDLSDDSSIADDAAFERRALAALAGPEGEESS